MLRKTYYSTFTICSHTYCSEICPLVLPADSDHTWKIAHVPMEVGVKFRYSFQAVRGNTAESTGGIYIDDISLTETRCPNAVWRVQNFAKIMETADHNTVIDSPRFYSPEGYGYGVRITPLSGYTDYTGNYTGLYFHLVSGENDAVLQWPAENRQATLVVMDQDPDIKLRMSTARSLTTDRRKSKCKYNIIQAATIFNSTVNIMHEVTIKKVCLEGRSVNFFLPKLTALS